MPDNNEELLDRASLKSLFEAGDKPTQKDFEFLIDSCFNRVDEARIDPSTSELFKIGNIGNDFVCFEPNSDMPGGIYWYISRKFGSDADPKGLLIRPGSTEEQTLYIDAHVNAKSFNSGPQDLVVETLEVTDRVLNDLPVDGTVTAGGLSTAGTTNTGILGFNGTAQDWTVQADGNALVINSTGGANTLHVGPSAATNRHLRVHGNLTLTNDQPVNQIRNDDWDGVTDDVYLSQTIPTLKAVADYVNDGGVTPNFDYVTIDDWELDQNGDGDFVINRESGEWTLHVGPDLDTTTDRHLHVHGSLTLTNGDTVNKISNSTWSAASPDQDVTIPTQAAVAAYVGNGGPPSEFDIVTIDDWTFDQVDDTEKNFVIDIDDPSNAWTLHIGAPDNTASNRHLTVHGQLVLNREVGGEDKNVYLSVDESSGMLKSSSNLMIQDWCLSRTVESELEIYSTDTDIRTLYLGTDAHPTELCIHGNLSFAIDDNDNIANSISISSWINASREQQEKVLPTQLGVTDYVNGVLDDPEQVVPVECAILWKTDVDHTTPPPPTGWAPVEGAPVIDLDGSDDVLIYIKKS